MKKKFISVLTAILLIVTMIIPTMGADDDGNWGEDNTPWNISISNSKLLGSYQLGTSKEFQLEYYPSGSVGLKAIRYLEITGDAEVSDFEYYENGQWNDVSEFSTEITFTTSTMQRVRVTFHEAGVYTVKFWATSISGEQSVVSKRRIVVSNEEITLCTEPETTKPEEDESTSVEPTTPKPVTDESTSAEPTTTKKITETTTVKAPVATEKINVAKTKITKATKKKSAKKVKISLKKVKKAYGYEIKVSTSSKFKKKKTITKITRKTKCTLRN